MAEQNNGGGNPGAGASGAGGGQPDASAQPNGSGQKLVTGADGQGQGGGTGEKVFTYKEDRSDYVPRHRLNEVGTKLTAAEQRAVAAEKALEIERKRVRAAMGIDPVSPEAAEEAEIKSMLKKLGVRLTDDEQAGLTAEDIEELKAAAAVARQTAQAGWKRHASVMIGDAESGIAKALGSDKLNDRQKGQVLRAYRAEAEAAHNAREQQFRRGERETMETIPGDNDFLARHEAGDKTLIAEFVKNFLEDFVEPARRSAQSALLRRQRPVPSGERTRTPNTGAVPEIDYNDEKAFKQALGQARAARG